jgi:hypothetical protein
VVGFNHNLKHAGRVFHVQTEDSGLPRAHFLTHLYIGGNILASAKGSYGDKLEDPELPRLVRKMMEDQHKQMVRRLVAGEFTELAAKFSPHYEPGVLADGHTGPAAVNVEGAAPNEAAAVARLSPEPPAPPVPQAPLAPLPAAKAGATPPGAPLRMFEERPLPARAHHEQAPSTRMPLITREAASAATTLEEAFAAAAAQLAADGPAPELLNPPPRTRPKPPASAPAAPAGKIVPPVPGAAPSAASPAANPIPVRVPAPPQPARAPAPSTSILAPPTASHPSPLPAASAPARPLLPVPAAQPPPPPPITQPSLPAFSPGESSAGARKPPSFGGIAPGAFAGSAGVTRGPGSTGSTGEYRVRAEETGPANAGPLKVGTPTVGTPTKSRDWEIPHDTAPGSLLRRPAPGQGLRPLNKPPRTAPTAPPDTLPEMPKVQARPVAPREQPAQSNILASPSSDPPPMMDAPASSAPPPARMPGAPLPSTTRIAASSFRGIPPPLVTPVGSPALVPRFAPQSQRVPPVMQPIAPLPRAPPPNPLNQFADTAKAPGPDEEPPALFAEELISERSLDEVILAFLSSGDADKK